MQSAIIIINLILSVIGLVCIHLKTLLKDKHVANAVKRVGYFAVMDGRTI